VSSVSVLQYYAVPVNSANLCCVYSDSGLDNKCSLYPLSLAVDPATKKDTTTTTAAAAATSTTMTISTTITNINPFGTCCTTIAGKWHYQAGG